MMKKYNKISLILLLMVLSMQGVKAQDVGFSQFYANPLYLNPAFAGSKVAPRISLTYRAQWPGLVSAFTTVSGSYDQYIPDLHGGIGAIVMSDRQGDHGILGTTSLGAMYSFRFKLHEDIFVNLALHGMSAWPPTTSTSPARAFIVRTPFPSSFLPMLVV